MLHERRREEGDAVGHETEQHRLRRTKTEAGALLGQESRADRQQEPVRVANNHRTDRAHDGVVHRTILREEKKIKENLI